MVAGDCIIHQKLIFFSQHIPDISVFEPRVFESQVVKIKTGKNSYTLLIHV